MVIGYSFDGSEPYIVVMYGDVSNGYSALEYVIVYEKFAPSKDHTAVNAVRPACDGEYFSDPDWEFSKNDWAKMPFIERDTVLTISFTAV
jgi:hypothetical protein